MNLINRKFLKNTLQFSNALPKKYLGVSNGQLNIRSFSSFGSGPKPEKSLTSSSILNMFDIPKTRVDTSIDRNNGLHTYMKRVGIMTGKNLGITAATGTTVYLSALSYPELMLSSGGCVGWVTAMIAGFYSCYKVVSIHPRYEKENNSQISINTPERLLWSNLFFVCQGIVISPSLIVFAQNVPAAAIVTTALTLGSISTALYLPKGKMLPLGPALYTSLWGLIGCGIVGIFIPAFHTINLYTGVGIFTLYNMYDTHKLIKDYDDGYVDHLSHSLEYSLNFINIFIRLLEILSRNDKK